MQNAILKEKISLIQDSYVNGGHCRNKVLSKIMNRNPENAWFLFIEGILRFRIPSEDELKSWKDLHQNFFIKTDNEDIEINKRKLFNYFWKMIPPRTFKFEGAELPDIPTIEGEYIPSEYFRFIKEELKEHLTAKQRRFLDNRIDGVPTGMSPQAESRMKKRIAVRAERVFKMKYPVKSDFKIRRLREQRIIEEFLNTNPSVEATIDFFVENLEMKATDTILYDTLPIQYRKFLIKYFIQDDEWLALSSPLCKEVVKMVLEELRKFVGDEG